MMYFLSSSINYLLYRHKQCINVNCIYLQILVDDLLVYNGVLDPVGGSSRGRRNVSYRTVIFSTEREFTKGEQATRVM